MVDVLRHRWNNYKDNARKFEREHCMQRHFYEHFNLPGHLGFLNVVSVTLIDNTGPKAPTKRENYWIHILKIFITTTALWQLMRLGKNRTPCAQVYELPQSHCGDSQEGALFL